jgi:Xaa-Pro dipeptidase
MGIPPAEYHGRLDRLQADVAAAGLDLYVVSSEESILYLTGIAYAPLERPFFILVRPRQEPEMLVPMLERDHLASSPSVQRVHTYWDFPAPPGEGWAEKLRDLIRYDLAIGVEPTLPVEVWRNLADLQPRIVPLVDQLRLIKSPAEIEMIRYAAHYADMGVERVLRTAYSGVSLLELFAQGRSVQMAMLREVGYNAVISSILVGAWPAPGSAMPHDVPAPEARLCEGPHIALALTRVDGYCAECERTFFLSPPTPELREAFAAVREASRRAYELARPGVPTAELDTAANDFLRELGYGEYLLHRTGHGFGLSAHEGPYVAEGSEDVLSPGMLISIEPGVYLPKVGGIRHSDTVLITEDGYESLTRCPQDLESLTLHSARPRQRLVGAAMRRMAGLRDPKKEK